MPRDAEAWLAERGIEREPIRVDPTPSRAEGSGASAEAPGQQPPPQGTTGASAEAGAADPRSGGPAASAEAADPSEVPITGREARHLAEQAAADRAVIDAEQTARPGSAEPRLEDDVAEAIAYVRRSTSAAPQAEARVRAKLIERGWAPAVVERTLERARREGLVDDQAMAAALVEERRRKGHAPARIRRDLGARGFTDEVLDPLLAPANAEDQEAAAFDLAQRKAGSLSAVAAETAFRRVAAYVARRGYPDGLARKVAREAVFADREEDRTAGH